MNISIKQQHFGQTATKQDITCYTLTNKNNQHVSILTLGATLQRWLVDTAPHNIVLGFDDVASYQRYPYFGSIIGRVANRISHASLTINNITYNLDRNEGLHHLHGGFLGLDKAIWHAETDTLNNAPALRLHYLSRSSEGGYPGNALIEVTYILQNDNTLRIEYSAVVDRTTPINLCNHSYFNLANSNTLKQHDLLVNAEQITLHNKDKVATGACTHVANTAYDFRQKTPLAAHEQMGIDQNFVLNATTNNTLNLAASLRCNETARSLHVYTSLPCLQIYTGNHFDQIPGANNAVYDRFAGIALETQGFPDAVNHAQFPSILCSPEQPYYAVTEYRLGD